MEYQNVVRDFAQRTLTNLDVIESAHAKNPEAPSYEVTQLVNSMMGLLVFPQQRYFNSIPETPIDTLKGQGWPIPYMEGTPPHASNLRDLMRCLRNGISHFNIEFTSDDDRTISGLRIWNYETDPTTGRLVRDEHRHLKKVWEATLTLDQLREITRRFVHLILEGRK